MVKTNTTVNGYDGLNLVELMTAAMNSIAVEAEWESWLSDSISDSRA